MRRPTLSGIRTYISLSLLVILIGGIVFTTGFGICLYLSRTQVTELTNKGVTRDLDVIHNYVDGQLQSIEDVAYALSGAEDRNYATFDPASFDSEESMFVFLENILNVNANICGIAIGLEPSLSVPQQGPYGFAAYVTNVSGKSERLRLGGINDYRKKEWYCKAATRNKPYWSLPFRETNMGKVVTCFSLPLHDRTGNFIGVLALDINTEAFRLKCNEIMPFKNAEVTLVDRNHRFISHPDTTFLLRNVSDYHPEQWNKAAAHDLAQQKKFFRVESKENKSLFYFDTIQRTQWIISIECPIDEVYSGVYRMRRDTTLIAIASILFMIVCFIYLFRRLQRITLSKANLDKEVKIASEIQMDMTPKHKASAPEFEQFDVFGFLQPARDIGGDLYDYFFHNDHLYFCIGDVSGKGIPASLFMSATHYLFRSTIESCEDLSEAVANINHSLCTNNGRNMFVTYFCGKLDLSTGKLDFCNAGHNAPILISHNPEKACFLQTSHRLPLGIMSDVTFQTETLNLQNGDALFLYTDGITESMNLERQEFGDEQTLQCVTAHASESTQDIVKKLYKDIQQHAAGAEQSDDITMLCFRYNSSDNS